MRREIIQRLCQVWRKGHVFQPDLLYKTVSISDCRKNFSLFINRKAVYSFIDQVFNIAIHFGNHHMLFICHSPNDFSNSRKLNLYRFPTTKIFDKGFIVLIGNHTQISPIRFPLLNIIFKDWNNLVFILFANGPFSIRALETAMRTLCRPIRDFSSTFWA